MVIIDQSDGVGMCFCDSVFFSLPVSPPADVEEKECASDGVLEWYLVTPRFVLFGPCDFVVVGELCFISLVEILFEDLLFGLEGGVFVVPAPVVEVVVIEAYVSECSRSSQHIFIFITNVIHHRSLSWKVQKVQKIYEGK